MLNFTPVPRYGYRVGVPRAGRYREIYAGVHALVRDLNRVYRGTPALHRLDHDSSGFAWLSWQDEAQSVLSFLRKNGDEHAVVILNFTPVPREGYRVGVPRLGRYREMLNSDSQYYGGSNSATTSPKRSPRRAWISRTRSS